MQQQKSSTKTLIVILVIVAIGAGGFFYLSGSPQDTESSLAADPQATEVTAETAKIIALLALINGIEIDTKFFAENQVYRSLVDHTVPVIPQAVGKPNPFLYTLTAPAKPK